MMLALAEREAGTTYVRHWRDGAWNSMSWGEFGAAIRRAAAGLHAMGVQPGQRVLLVSASRPEFLIADNAVMALGAITVPTYVANTVSHHAHVIGDCTPSLAITDTHANGLKLKEAAAQAGVTLPVVLMEKAGMENFSAWDEVMSFGDQPPPMATDGEATACIIYTSGTGGAPRGAMLPHRAMLSNTQGVRLAGRGIPFKGGRYLSFLPMSHSYEHTVGGFILPALGMELVLSRGAEHLVREFAEHRPTLITTVPRLFEVLKTRILSQVEGGGVKRWLFDRALSQGLRRLDGPPLNPLERLLDPVLDRLVRAKVRARFGGELVAMISGGARLDPELSGFFLAMGLTVLQGYGQTEAGPVVSVNLPWSNDRHTVGKPLPGVEARIAEDGELLVCGELEMQGYWNAPEATAEALRPDAGGKTWLHTGDIGVLDEAGRIRITDRKKDFIKLVGGMMVAPARVEALLTAEPAIAQAVVAGEGEAALVALLVPAEGRADELEAAVSRVNKRLAGHERIRRWAKLDEAFSIENGLLTPSMKTRRKQVLEHHSALIRALQSGTAHAALAG
ncbi:long-chain fatty acid--CoA ligase [Rhodovarius crocodyli]|uniref:Long-chain fatty acid--CoA ligase n=2 Tax=Rhodovarius crocodyli TaxID=1979269 RepID=A0A437MPW9_9PROT|nr:long-chain fatty acid--CoA ligase [Rhodovarius crocodyli]